MVMARRLGALPPLTRCSFTAGADWLAWSCIVPPGQSRGWVSASAKVFVVVMHHGPDFAGAVVLAATAPGTRPVSTQAATERGATEYRVQPGEALEARLLA